ncbi:MAG: hypothetical protein A3G95_03615 [Flavobacteria bacterium RIFCSPLOWO2_12_FULL_31_7]|nr:MAG: hypothetical protein A3G95_03615 [Flavobacteria bacterium RIFCSPLOWO2_12_FULL_31_7]
MHTKVCMHFKTTLKANYFLSFFFVSHEASFLPESPQHFLPFTEQDFSVFSFFFCFGSCAFVVVENKNATAATKIKFFILFDFNGFYYLLLIDNYFFGTIKFIV